MATRVGAVAAVWRYPVKSMLGEDLAEAPLGEHGIVGDRAYAVVDPATGKTVTARKWRRLLELRAAYPEPPSLGGDLPPVHVAFPDGSVVDLSDPSASSKLSAFLEADLRVAPPGSFPQAAQHDGGDLLIISTATLDLLQDRYRQGRFDARRFRPNLLVESPVRETEWQGATLAIGDAAISIGGMCPRCVMTTLPQTDLPDDPRILESVKTHVAGRVGAYGHVVRTGTIRRGDAVEVRREESA